MQIPTDVVLEAHTLSTSYSTNDWTGADAGVRLLESIEEIHLQQTPLIIVRGVKISDAILLDLRAELPLLVIQKRGLARLGVRSGDSRGGCEIGGVEPESAAAIAGLESHDQIVEIDGVEIEDFEKLVNVIYEKEPGSDVPIVFYRDNKEHKVVVKPLPWPKETSSDTVPTDDPAKPVKKPIPTPPKAPQTAEPPDTIAKPVKKPIPTPR